MAQQQELDEGIDFTVPSMPAEALAVILARAEYECMENDEGWFATIPGYDGLWGHGTTRADAERDLASALPEWIALGAHLGHALT